MATKDEERKVEEIVDLRCGRKHLVEEMLKLVDKAYERGYAAAVADALDDGNFGGK